MAFMAIFDGTSAYAIDTEDFIEEEMENLGEFVNFDDACDHCDNYNETV